MGRDKETTADCLQVIPFQWHGSLSEEFQLAKEPDGSLRMEVLNERRARPSLLRALDKIKRPQRKQNASKDESSKRYWESWDRE